MMTSLVRARSGTKIMPVTANIRPFPRYSRRPNPLVNLAGLGQTALLQRPGPGGTGTEIVDENGNVVYTADQVAANPALLSQISSSVCPGGLLPTWFPGGQSTCAGSGPGSQTPYGTEAQAQYDYPVDGVCPDPGWCFTGTSMTDTNSYTWQGGGSPTTPNPATIASANPLPSSYQGSFTTASGTAVVPTSSCSTGYEVDGICELPPGMTLAQAQAATGAGQPVGTPATTTPVSNVLNPPTGKTSVTPQSLANGSPQSGNTNLNVGAGADNASGSGGSAATCPTGDTCTYFPSIPDTYVYIGGAAILALILFGMKK
jgi:hypothetical protein